MTEPLTRRRLPKITVTEEDFESLSRLANAALGTMPDIADELLSELERARVVEGRKLKPGIVRMGSNVTYTSDGAAPRTVTLVYPGEADIEKGRISVLTPIGAGLIGLSEGQTIVWPARDGRTHELAIVEVKPPVPA